MFQKPSGEGEPDVFTPRYLHPRDGGLLGLMTFHEGALSATEKSGKPIMTCDLKDVLLL